MMQGGCAVSKDVPPFCIALRENEICGLNAVGLRRAGFSPEQRMELKRVYRLLFRSGKNLREAVAEAQKISGTTGKVLIDFVASAKRGVCADVSRALDGLEEE
jgi:UDP-N-acetylglucosamine acyltransferase